MARTTAIIRVTRHDDGCAARRAVLLDHIGRAAA